MLFNFGKPKEKPVRRKLPWEVTDKGDHLAFFHSGDKRAFKVSKKVYLGEGVYKKEGYKPPTLIDVWETLWNEAPGTTGFIYSGCWGVIREGDCFNYVLDISEKGKEPEIVCDKLMDDPTAEDTHFIEFLIMLDEEAEDISRELSKQREHKPDPL